MIEGQHGGVGAHRNSLCMFFLCVFGTEGCAQVRFGVACLGARHVLKQVRVRWTMEWRFLVDEFLLRFFNADADAVAFSASC